jgi:hypothetical protein
MPRKHTICLITLLFSGLLAVLMFTGCDPTFFSPAKVTVCVESGVQCQLPSGPLGVCERSLCPTGETSPCFQCISQH